MAMGDVRKVFVVGFSKMYFLRVLTVFSRIHFFILRMGSGPTEPETRLAHTLYFPLLFTFMSIIVYGFSF